MSLAFQDIGVTADGEVPSADQLAVGANALQNLIDSLGAVRLSMLSTPRQVVNLINGQQNYTIGTGGDLNIVRPTQIDQLTCVTFTGSTPLETPVTLLTEDMYAAINVKSVGAAIVLSAFYDAGWSAGLANLFVYPYPNVSGMQLAFYSPKAITGFSDMTTDYTFAPGYAEMLEYNLAKRLLIKFPRAGGRDDIVQMANETMAAIKRANLRPEVLRLDPAIAGRGQWNIISGLYEEW